MDVRGAVGAVLDLAALDVGDRLGDVLGHRAGLGVRHQPARPEHAPGLADRGHHVGGRDRGVEVDLAAHHLLDELLAADHVGAGLGGLARLLADREHADPNRAAGAVGQRHGAAKRLVGLARVDAEAEASSTVSSNFASG